MPVRITPLEVRYIIKQVRNRIENLFLKHRIFRGSRRFRVFFAVVVVVDCPFEGRSAGGGVACVFGVDIIYLVLEWDEAENKC